MKPGPAGASVDLFTIALAEANRLGGELNSWVRAECAGLMAAGKVVGVVGGDHSVPYGAFQAAAAAHGSFGILHFDAHSDTRDAYEGFLWSHASIMRNALRDIPQVSRIVQVGIRDYCRQEAEFVAGLGPRATVFPGRELARRRFAGPSSSCFTASPGPASGESA